MHLRRLILTPPIATPAQPPTQQTRANPCARRKTRPPTHTPPRTAPPRSAVGQLPWAVTANMAVRNTAARFDGRFPRTGGGEDIDFCLKACPGKLLAVPQVGVAWANGARPPPHTHTHNSKAHLI